MIATQRTNRIPTAAFVAAIAVLAPLGAALPGDAQDDAGSGRDAGDGPATAVPIQPGTVYKGTVTGQVIGETTDWYSFEVRAGDAIEAHVAGPGVCLHLYDDSGIRAQACNPGFVEIEVARATADSNGTWHAVAGSRYPQDYSFSVALNAAAPAPDGALAQVQPPGDGPGLPAVAPATQAGPHAVVAVVDTGINPYHEFFRAPALVDHPSTWLPGFPADATSVPLSFGAPSVKDAVAADGFASLARSSYDLETDGFTTRLYTFPGTRVVGAVSFSEYRDLFLGEGTIPVYDENGHGTHSAGLAAGADLPGAEGDVLVVMVEVGQVDFVEGVRWAARQPWIDAISVSLGTIANVPQAKLPGGTRMDEATLEAAAAGKPVFIASGNGFTNTGLLPDHCSTYTSAYTGPAWVTRIGAADPATDNPTTWHCVPVEAVARTRVASPENDSFVAAGSATGTSAATPNAAGAFAQVLLDARRAGAAPARTEALAHLLNASRPAPLRPGVGAEPGTQLDQGYGLIDGAAVARANARWRSGLGPEPRPELDAFFAADRALRQALWAPGGALSPEVPRQPQDDAGSGGDAPGTPARAVRVEPGVVYRGHFDGTFLGDADDYYAFDVQAGQTIRTTTAGTLFCARLFDPGLVERDLACGEKFMPAEMEAVADAAGTWNLEIGYVQPDDYRFAIGLDAWPPQA
ncbi:MAG TPA: S8/S53 family peptidase [Candidatus Thermoplasmatota archaeon]|nr:S8/S53 family peptidase [Candidatus Thermoplasmatota archaeon]